MDLNTVTEVLVARSREDLRSPRAGDAFLAGGTALFGQPADHLRRLVDLSRMGWQPVAVTDDGLQIGATCTLAELRGFAMPPGGRRRRRWSSSAVRLSSRRSRSGTAAPSAATW